ncbi:unnamed protein product, partial [Iphiclides podalirius]
MGKCLILIGGYTFSKPSHGHTWPCSTKRTCKAKLKLDDEGTVVELNNHHIHPPRKFFRTSSGKLVRRGKDLILLDGYTYSNSKCNTWICSTHYPQCRASLKRDRSGRVYGASNTDYEIIKSQRGKDLLLVGGYTFNQRSLNSWQCSTHHMCRAKLNLCRGRITFIYNEHDHPPRKLWQSKSGMYYRFTFLRDSSVHYIRTFVAGSTDYEIITSQRGKDLLVVDGYTFNQRSVNSWKCSTNQWCRAKLTLTDGKIVFIMNVHNHPPKKHLQTKKWCFNAKPSLSYDVVVSQRGKSMILINGHTYSRMNNSSNTWVCSKKNAKCKAKLRVDHEGSILDISEFHCHPPRSYIDTRGRFADDLKFIKLSENKRLLMVNGYTFAKTSPRHWYCSKKAKSCKARVFLNAEENAVVFRDDNHNHPPPEYGLTCEGYYVKITG